MANINFYRNEKGRVDIFNVSLEDHRALCNKYILYPNIYLSHTRGSDMFYRSAHMQLCGVEITLYSDDSSVEDAIASEVCEIINIKQRLAKIRREAEEERED